MATHKEHVRGKLLVDGKVLVDEVEGTLYHYVPAKGPMDWAATLHVLGGQEAALRLPPVVAVRLALDDGRAGDMVLSDFRRTGNRFEFAGSGPYPQ